MTRPLPCPYFKGRVEQRVIADISHRPQHYDNLAEAGFRRIENWLYKPVCEECNACLPIRIVSHENAHLTYRQKRILAMNKDLTRSIIPNIPHEQHYKLFKKYINERHNDGQMTGMDEDDFTAMIVKSPINTCLLEYKDNEKIIAVMLIDQQKDGLSAVYSFFDPDEAKRSLGNFMVLDALALVRQMQLAFLYLGYYIEKQRKMSYKSAFKPAEILKNGHWMPLND